MFVIHTIFAPSHHSLFALSVITLGNLGERPGRSLGESRPHPLFLDQTDSRWAETGPRPVIGSSGSDAGLRGTYIYIYIPIFDTVQ